MKKTVSILMAVLVAISLCACGGTTDVTYVTSSKTQTTSNVSNNTTSTSKTDETSSINTISKQEDTSSKNETVISNNEDTSSKQQTTKMVYRTPTGKRYHLSATCGGKNSRKVSLENAIESGLTPCQKCAK